ncbi:MAG: three-Cys-motif partner protein TcmP, partial [Helicobacter sp.]|nr:three-Cys-motif partner protein TcmP [Helicobacter sp.]
MSKSNKYIWRVNEELPIIDDHSLVKLEIIEKYLETYIKHLAILPFTDKLKFAIIDGFSGGGLYRAVNNQIISGSPLRILGAIQRLKKEISIERETKNFKNIEFDIPIYLIEKNKATFEFLQKTLSEKSLSSMCEVINGEFEKIYLQIIQKLKMQKYQRAIFILDQYGYADATINTIKNILTNFKNTEVILTFACDSLIDYLSVKNKTALINLGLDNNDIEHLLDTKIDNDDNRKILQFNL